MAYLISFSLSSHQISLSPSATQLSLSSLVSISLAPYFFLTFIFFLSLSSSLVLTLLHRLQAAAVPPVVNLAWSSLSLSLSSGCGNVSNGSWLILVKGGGLIGLWVWDLGWSQIELWWLMLWCFFFFFINGWYWWSVVDFVGVVGGCGLWRLICGYGWWRILCVYIYIFVKVFLDYFNVLDILF